MDGRVTVHDGRRKGGREGGRKGRKRCRNCSGGKEVREQNMYTVCLGTLKGSDIPNGSKADRSDGLNPPAPGRGERERERESITKAVSHNLRSLTALSPPDVN